MTRDNLIGILHNYKEGLVSFEDVITAVDAYSSASNGSKPDVSGSLPTLEDAWNAGVDEGGSRVGNFEWGIRRKNVEFSEWYEAELKYHSSWQ